MDDNVYRCETCAWSEMGEVEGRLECHFNPPRLLVKTTLYEGDVPPELTSIWPMIRGKDWCGRHLEKD